MKVWLAEWIDLIFGMRKVLALFFIYVISSIFCYLHLVNGSDLIDLFKTVTVVFFGANSVEHLVTAVKDHMSEKLTIGTASVDDKKDQ